MLEEGARDFINHPRGVSLAGNRVIVSSIYFWFQSDFGDSEKEVIRHLKKYLSPEKLNTLNSLESFNIEHQYDWALNE